MKFFVLGSISSFILGGIVYGTTQLKDVYLSPFKIILNGAEYSNEMPVLNYEGRTYLALRELGTVLGNNIDFIDDKVIINDKGITELDINSNQVERLYNYIPRSVKINSHVKNAYQSKNITKEDLELEYLLANAFDRYYDSINIDTKYEWENEKESIGIVTETFEAKDLQKICKQMYGKELENCTFTKLNWYSAFEYSNGKYVTRFDIPSGMEGPVYTTYSKRVRAYIKEDNIYIIDRYLSLVYENDVEEKFDIYTNSLLEKKVGSIEINDSDFEEKLEAFNMLEYIHTFKKTEDGNYYWYCTQPY